MRLRSTILSIFQQLVIATVCEPYEALGCMGKLFYGRKAAFMTILQSKTILQITTLKDANHQQDMALKNQDASLSFDKNPGPP